MNDDLDHATLVTETADGIMRLWRCFADEPHYFVLWLTLNGCQGDLVSVAYLWLRSGSQMRLMSILQDGSVKQYNIQVRLISC